MFPTPWEIEIAVGFGNSIAAKCGRGQGVCGRIACMKKQKPRTGMSGVLSLEVD
jgi:hypothetical protein